MAALPKNFVKTANQRFGEATTFWRNWKTEARLEYAFIAGDQWLADDLEILKVAKRPPITFNYSEKMIDAVVGAEVNSRQEVRYAPRDLTDGPMAELWTNAAKWARDEGNFDDEESDAFRDCLICGLGWTRTKMDYEKELDGMIEVGRVDPLEMTPDPSATKVGLLDRRYHFRSWWVDERVAKRNWPGKILPLLDDGENTNRGVSATRAGDGYNDNDIIDAADMHKGQVQIRHYECVEYQPVYRVESGGEVIEVEPGDFSEMRADLDAEGIQYVKQFKRVYYHAFFANETLLEAEESPCQDGFMYQCMTGKRDRNRNTWYGLVRVMKDPQRWANKWLSQIMHIINSNSKGGLMAEVSAFVDPKKAEETWTQPDAITLFKEGALSGKKVQEKQMAQFPTGLDRLMEFALSSLPQVTGINLEALGLAGREQANVLEQSRKQAAYGLLAPVFDSLRRYRKNQGRVLLYFIHNYISDGRLIRIGGPESKQFVPLTKSPGALRYDIIVDQSPQAPDVKEKTWESLLQILPAMMKSGIPIPPDLLDYVPLPTALALKWKQFAAQNRTSPEQIQKMQQQLQQTTDENEKLQQQLRDKTAEMQIKMAEAKAEIELKQMEIVNKIKLARMELEGKMALERQKNDADIQQQRQEGFANIAAQMHEVVQGGENEAGKNSMDAINKLLEVIGKLDHEEATDKP